VVRLSCAGDRYAAPVLPPNLLQVERSDAARSVERFARQLGWARVRLLFIGHKEGGKEGGGESGGHGGDAEAPAGGDAGTAGGDAGTAGGTAAAGSPFALLDRELLWMIADWLIVIECRDGRPIRHV
jgi:hypothetical protein